MTDATSHRIAGGLSARLLVLTVAFVMASVLLIFVPSVTRERLTYLKDRLDAARLAIFALEATPDNMVSKELADMLLAHVGTHGIVVHMADRTLMLAQNMPPSVDATYDLRNETMLQTMGDTVATLFQSGNRVIRVLGISPKDRAVTVEVLLDEAPLRRQLWEFGARVFAVSFVISLITAALLYFTLQWLLVAPLRRMTASMMAFRGNPEDETRAIRPSQRNDEVGLAERELAAMQDAVRQSLRQKERLAALGTAVSKINHDLRGILSTARLTSDSLAGSDSPEVKRVVPALLAAIDRAVALCTGTLNYTRDNAPPLRRSRFTLAALTDEIAGAAAAPNGNGFRVVNEVPPGLIAHADRDQLFRVLENLTRNAAECGARMCTISAAQNDAGLRVAVTDDGPGLPPKARAHLFTPFSGSARPGGTGLGLAIARELMRAHGGDIVLEQSDAKGTVFALILPADDGAASRAPAARP
ncbi:MAG: HAMP domain-containing histidine kinase [Alphaproteobacteria bacterium]|nr:HAMP domain-containing histidine kinase [Alphaproteobacteria bacterium]